jgi:N-acetylmuramoyl-L-alanine amidase
LAAFACLACAIFAMVGAAQGSPAPKKLAVATSTPVVTATPPAPAPVAVKLAAPTTRPTRAPSHTDLRGIGAVTLLHRTPIHAQPTGKSPAISQVASGITLPVDGGRGNWIHVMTPCELGGWIRNTDATLVRAGRPTSSLSDAVIVIDPGHGGTESGALGPDGVQEQDVNMQISRRLATDLKGSRIYMTRTGHYNVGLRFRALLASRLHANAFLSMHNNSGPIFPSLHPGTQAWHQVHSTASAKLASLVWRNVYTALSRYHRVHWVSSKKIGPLARANTKGTDYYAVLRESNVPSVIVESLFINNKMEERMLQKSDIQSTIAQATAQSVQTFITEGGASKVSPYKIKLDKSGGLPSHCVDPA